MKPIYLDNSATTRPYPEVITLMSRVQEENYGNPSSTHAMGMEGEKLLTLARKQVNALFRSEAGRVIFTSGGTEANNLALKGAARRLKKRGRKIITSAIEHSSVLDCCRSLAEEGFELKILPVDSKGQVDLQSLEKELNRETVLLSLIHVSNEIGTVQPLTEAGQLMKKSGAPALFHIDAVQSFGKLPLEVDSWGADLVSASAHKTHGPKGTGCLWLRNGVMLDALIQGGDQEEKLRPGTENCPGIAGFGLAAQIAADRSLGTAEKMRRLKEIFLLKLQEEGAAAIVNGPALEEAAPHILNLSFPGIKAEVLLNALSGAGIYVSAGSACHSRHPEPSHVLEAIGLERMRLESALRFSFSILNTEEEALRAAESCAGLIKNLKNFLGS